MEKYSVLMSLYCKEDPGYLRQAVDSMLNQTVLPSEIVIVKDGPLTDELEEVLVEYTNKYAELFNIVVSEENIGLGRALNLGLNACQNELVARMDTDDISFPERCEKQLKVFEKKPELSIVGAYVDEFFNDVDNIISTRKVPTESDEIYEFGKRRSPFNHPVVMYRKSRVLENGGYADLRRNQDVDLFGRMLYAGCKSENIPESLLYFRCNEDLAKRRRSLENTKSYIRSIKMLWKLGYSSFLDYLVVFVGQTVVFICPTKLQQFIYAKFLRN